MSEPPTSEERLRALDDATAAIETADEPYWPARELHSLSMRLMTEFGVAYGLYWIWSELTDWYELRPGERREAEASMRRAAEEWRAATDDEARDAYLERWLVDELELSRNIGREF